MKKLLFTILSVMLSSVTFSQDLSKMKKSERDAYLVKTAKEVTLTFCPDFYSENFHPEISEAKVFCEKTPNLYIDFSKFNGLRYYEVKLCVDSTDTKCYHTGYMSVVEVWEHDGQPMGIMSPRRIGLNFFTRSYKDWVKEGVKETEKIKYVEYKSPFRDKDGNIHMIIQEF